MGLWDLFLLAVALGTDAFSLGVGIGLRGIGWRQIYRSSGVIGLFHFLMPLAGLWFGQMFGQAAGAVGQAVGAILLLGLGARMIWEAMPARDRVAEPVQLHTWGVATLAFCVSIDALLVGFSLGTLGTDLTVAALLFGVVGGAMAAIGLIFGKKAGDYFVHYAGMAGGAVLLLLGLKFLGRG